MPVPRSLVEARIRAAQEAGALDKLPGAGKPLPRDVADDLPADERHEVLLHRSLGGAVPEEVVLLKEIEILEQRVAAGEGDVELMKRWISDKRLRLSILHEQQGRFLSARRAGEQR